MITIVKNSIFKNLTNVLHGPVLLLHINNAGLIIKKTQEEE